MGAGTIIGPQAVAASEPDGYTLLMGTFAHAVNPSLNPKLPYCSRGANEGLVMVARPPEEPDRYVRGEEERWAQGDPGRRDQNRIAPSALRRMNIAIRKAVNLPKADHIFECRIAATENSPWHATIWFVKICRNRKPD
jgi:hypothetical protein